MIKFNNKKKILLVNNDEHQVRDISSLLEMRGYHVKTAICADEIINDSSSSYDLILLNQVLSQNKELNVSVQLKKLQKVGCTPVIILSNKFDVENMIEGFYLGADDYLVKPFNKEELIARIEAVIRRSSFLRERKVISPGESVIMQELKRIIAQEKIIPHFQPIYQFKPFKLTGLEVLSRPEQDTLLSNPEILFKTALQFGCYEELEMLSWRKAVRYAEKFLNKEQLFLNCNPYFIEDSKCSTVKSIFEESNIKVENIILEITERSAVKDYKLFFERINSFRACGFRFAVDDVGGGYASLESVVETKPEVIKIDRHIINGISKEMFKKSIVKFIVSFCKENNIFCVAEGIETKEDLQTLLDLNVDAGQGYYLYRPTPEINIDDMHSVSAKVCQQ